MFYHLHNYDDKKFDLSIKVDDNPTDDSMDFPVELKMNNLRIYLRVSETYKLYAQVGKVVNHLNQEVGLETFNG